MCALTCMCTYIIGVTYLLGIPFFILGEVNPSYHVIWHLFVALAAVIHWFLMYIFILNTDISSVSTVVADAWSDAWGMIHNITN